MITIVTMLHQETTHIWPHKQKGTDSQVTQLENDAGIMAAFRSQFAAHHFDIRPVIEMNEIYVTAVGAIKEITSDAVFYTPHTVSIVLLHLRRMLNKSVHL